MDTQETDVMPIEAAYYETLADGRVRCELCPVSCVLREGQRGKCRQREVHDGRLIAIGYGRTVTAHVDPMEKKPLYHFLPGSAILSVGCNGCNLTCPHCQNWDIAQAEAPTFSVSPDRLAEIGTDKGSVGVAFTYTEPVVWFEYIRDSAPLIRMRGGVVVLVSNGYIEQAPLCELLPHLDAINVDVKAMGAEFYARVGGTPDVPRRTVELATDAGVHVEVTYLLIPGENDSTDEVGRFVEWVSSVNRSMPVHFSRFHPAYKSSAPPTPLSVMQRALEQGKKKLDYVYLGNVAGPSDTNCRECGSVLIERRGYATRVVGLSGSDCAGCGAPSGVVVSPRGTAEGGIG
jgi:pyruvate formate lyase activating enzyme